MASWKKVLVSGSNIEVNQITGSTALFSGDVDVQGTFSLPGFGDVSASLAGAIAGGDNLGNHTATQNINLNGYSLINILNASASGFVSASEFIGDGSKLTGIVTDLDINGTSGTINIDLATEALTFASTNGVTIAGATNTLTVNTAQDIQTTASPSFAGLDINGTADISGNVTLSGNAQTVTHSGTGNLTIASTSGNVVVDGVTMAGGTVSATSVSTTGNITVGGDLVVNGTTTTINTANLLVEDKWVLIASGSTAAGDGGIVVEDGTAGRGFALGYDATADRWVLQDQFDSSATNDAAFGLDEAAPNTGAYVGTVEVSIEDPGAAVPTYGGSSYGHGTIFVNEGSGDIYIYS